MSLSAASILHALLLTLLLGTTASVTAGNGDANPSVSTNADDTERYICYLCTGRNPFLIRYCPIYWDQCHLVCYDDYQASAATAAIPAAPVPTSLGPAASPANPSGANEDECYIMKLYWNGSYAIVTRLGCARIARCLLSCGGGDMAGSDRKALDTAPAAPATTAAVAVQGSLTPRLADFQRCGTQLTTPSLHGAVARARGARRRR